MSLLTTDEIEAHVETDLSTTALQQLIDDAEDEIVLRAGPHTEQTDDLIGGERYLFPSRPISAATSITETIGTTDTILSADDYIIRHDGRTLERLSTGTNGGFSWAPRVRIVYTPALDANRRKRVLIDLVRLAIQNNALHSEHTGDHWSMSKDYQKERGRILSVLDRRARLLA